MAPRTPTLAGGALVHVPEHQRRKDDHRDGREDQGYPDDAAQHFGGRLERIDRKVWIIAGAGLTLGGIGVLTPVEHDPGGHVPPDPSRPL
jgi:hypothetical protein